MIDVLLANDDPLMRELLFEWLGEPGYGVRVTDMPGGDGAQTLDQVRRVATELPVIAMSGGAFAGPRTWIAAAALKLGTAKVLAKPFERQEPPAAVFLAC